MFKNITAKNLLLCGTTISEGTFGVLNKSKEIPKKVKFGGNEFF